MSLHKSSGLTWPFVSGDKIFALFNIVKNYLMHFSCQLRPEVFSISTEGLPTFFIDVKFKRLHENRLKQQNDKNNDICQELETTERGLRIKNTKNRFCTPGKTLTADRDGDARILVSFMYYLQLKLYSDFSSSITYISIHFCTREGNPPKNKKRSRKMGKTLNGASRRRWWWWRWGVQHTAVVKKFISKKFRSATPKKKWQLNFSSTNCTLCSFFRSLDLKFIF